MRIGLDFIAPDGETIGGVMLHGGVNGFAHFSLDLAPEARKHRRIVIEGLTALDRIAAAMGFKALACGAITPTIARVAAEFGFTPSGYELPGYAEIWIKRLAGGHELSDAMIARACFPDAARSVLMLREAMRLSGATIAEALRMPGGLRRLAHAKGRAFPAPSPRRASNQLEH